MGLGLFLLSTATLAFEINLTRLFSVAQFYHFAFMVVSLALLGFGASGTFLAIFPITAKQNTDRVLGYLASGASACMLGSYLLVNWIPFDSFSIAWDRRQVAILLLQYLALVAPFFFSGLAISLLLTKYTQDVGKVYAVNLLGSSAGCLCALVAPNFLGGEGVVSLSVALSGLAALSCWLPSVRKGVLEQLNSDLKLVGKNARRILSSVLLLALLATTLGDLASQLTGRGGFASLELTISPYKSLSYALQYPEARIIYHRWNAFSRVDLVRSNGIRSLPGLSYRYATPPPPKDGMLVDGDDLNPVIIHPDELQFAEYLPTYLAFQLRPGAEALILEPRGGIDILTALAGSAREVTAVEVNPLIVEAAGQIYEAPRVQTIIESDRSYIRRTGKRFDVIVLSLISSYHPVRSGAYSLAEDYRYTREAFRDMLGRLKPGGLLLLMRWLQTPPSESLRAFALAVAALEDMDADPHRQIVALRGYNAATLLIQNGYFTDTELVTIREFAASRAFDLDYFPGITPEHVNRYNVLPEALDYQAYTGLLDAPSPQEFFDNYPFDVSQPTDDHPFFGHSFKWEQADQVIAEMGKTWQPFGGAGYFVVLALFFLALIASSLLIVLPLAVRRRDTEFADDSRDPPKVRLRSLMYFGLIGIAFLFVEIPLIQKFILFLGNPAYAMTTVLFTLLLFSGLGSQYSSRIPIRAGMGTLVFIVLILPIFLPLLFNHTLGWSIGAKLLICYLALAPVGFLMGIPFPSGLRLISRGNHSHGWIAWSWAVNGAASVVASVLAALIALSWGFSWVFYLGAACYAVAWLTGLAMESQRVVPPQAR